MNEQLKNKLAKRIQEGTLRSLSCYDGFTDFFSNDYLGLSRLKTHYKGINQGSTGSRLISGNVDEAEQCESLLAQFFRSEKALVFNSGYDANLGFFSAVPQKGDTVLYDEFIHASVRDGIRLSLANSFSFRHNSLDDLQKKIKKSTGTIYIATESLFSMGGDIAPLEELANFSREFNAFLVVDEAHASGVFGNNGEGLVSSLNLNDLVYARIVTFGKAYGAHGACVLGDEILIQYLINFARPFIYTTALPPESYLRISEMLTCPDQHQRRAELQSNIELFRNEMEGYKLSSAVSSPIQIFEVGDVHLLKKIAGILQDHKIAVKPIFSPTVPQGKELLRVCIHAFNTKQEILDLCSILKDQLP